MSTRIKISIISTVLLLFTCVGSFGIWFVLNIDKYISMPMVTNQGTVSEPKPEKLVGWNDFDSELLTYGGDTSLIEPVDIEYNLLYLPLTNEEELVDNLGLGLSYKCSAPWQFYGPRNVGIPDPTRVHGNLFSRSPYRSDDLYEITDAQKEAEIRLLGATHIISGHYRIEDEIMHLEMTLETPTQLLTKSFEVSEGFHFKATQKINEWVIANSEFDLDEETIHYLTLPFYGEEIINEDLELMEALNKSPDDPFWDEVIENNPDQAKQLWYHRARVADSINKGSFIREHPPEISEAPKYPADVMARVRFFAQRRQWPEFYQEANTFMTLWPGHQSFIGRIIFDLSQDDWERKEFIALLEDWVERTDENVMAKAWLASNYYDVGWKYRGNSYAYKVPAEDMDRFQNYCVAAGDIYSSIAKEHQLSPWMANQLIGIIGAIGYNNASIESVTLNVVNNFPREHYILTQALNFLKPKWGGSDMRAKSLYDQCVIANPKNPLLAQRLIWYYWQEAPNRLGNNQRLFTNLKTWQNRDPLVKEHLQEALQNVRNTGTGTDSIVTALSSSLMIRDWSTFTEIYKEHPGHYMYEYDYYSADWRVEFSMWLMMSQYDNNDIEYLAESVVAAEEIDKWAAENDRHSSNFASCCKMSKGMWEAVVALEYKEKEAAKSVPAFYGIHNGKSCYFYYTFALDQMPDDIFNRIDDFIKSSPDFTDYREPFYLQSIAHYKNGDKVKAKEFYEQAQDKKLHFTRLEALAKIIVIEEREFDFWTEDILPKSVQASE